MNAYKTNTPIDSKELGNLLGEFKVTPFPPRVLIVFPLFLALLCLWPVVIELGKDVEAQPDKWGRVLFFFVPLLVTSSLTSGVFWLRFKNRDNRLLVYEHGMIVRRRGQLSLFNWTEVKAFHVGEVNRGTPARCETHQSYRLQLENNTWFKLGSTASIVGWGNEIVDVDNLFQLLQSVMFKPILNRELEKFQHWETIDFGPIKATREGLKLKKQVVTWDRIKGLQRDIILNNGHGPTNIRILADPPVRQLFPLAKIPNFFVLEQLVQLKGTIPAAPRADGES